MRSPARRLAARALAALGLSLALAAPGRAAPGFRDPAADVQVHELDNGLTVLTLEDHTTPVVSFQVWVNAGSRNETRYTGIAHLFEHMMFKGTKHLGPEEYTQLIDARGGQQNAFTTNDNTVFFENVTSETLPLVIDLEAERFGNLVVDDALLDSERQVVLEERRMRTGDSPGGLAYQALMALTFQALPYRWPVIGWRSDVENVPVEACREFFRTFYAPENLVISIAGDFDTGKAMERIRLRFGRLRRGPPLPGWRKVEPEQRGERRAVVRFPVQAPIIQAAWHAPKSGDPDGPALDVLGEVLSAGRSSRLYRRLVRDGGLALGAGGGYWELQDAGLFMARVSVRPDARVEDAEAALWDEIARARDTRPSAEELEKAKRKLEVGMLSEMRTAYNLASRVANDWLWFGRVRPVEERLARYDAVTPEDVQRVARKYLQDRTRSVVLVVPEAKEAP